MLWWTYTIVKHVNQMRRYWWTWRVGTCCWKIFELLKTILWMKMRWLFWCSFFLEKGSVTMNSDNCQSCLIECNMTKKGIAKCSSNRKLWICSEQNKITNLLNYLHNITEWIKKLLHILEWIKLLLHILEWTKNVGYVLQKE